MNRLRLTDVYRSPDAVRVLYELLAERERRVRISHKKMPTFERHRAFVRKKPYKVWYLITDPQRRRLGSIYLSKNDEIGLFLFRKYRRKGCGEEALRLLMDRHRAVRRFLANVNPQNTPSIRFFSKLRFRHVQNTYEFTR